MGKAPHGFKVGREVLIAHDVVAASIIDEVERASDPVAQGCPRGPSSPEMRVIRPSSEPWPAPWGHINRRHFEAFAGKINCVAAGATTHVHHAARGHCPVTHLLKLIGRPADVPQCRFGVPIVRIPDFQQPIPLRTMGEDARRQRAIGNQCLTSRSRHRDPAGPHGGAAAGSTGKSGHPRSQSTSIPLSL